jgi:hypothetical protein
MLAAKHVFALCFTFHLHKKASYLLPFFVEMPWYCCVPGCKSGGRGLQEVHSTDKFPENGDDIGRWKKMIPREWPREELKSLRICSRHFQEDCFISKSADSNPRRSTKNYESNG